MRQRLNNRSSVSGAAGARASERTIEPAAPAATVDVKEPCGFGLGLDGDEPASYDSRFFAPLAAIEDRHFWFRARNEVIRAVVEDVTERLRDGFRFLEVGCGTGNVLQVLGRTCSRGSGLGMDLFWEGLRHARSRSRCPLVQADIKTPPFRKPFHLVCLFDVLEHLKDDVQVLRDVFGILDRGGTLVLTVPAHAYLWSYFDEASHHCRRYERFELERKLRDAGYRVEYVTEYMAALFPLVWLGRRLRPMLNRDRENDEDRSHELAQTELRVWPVLNACLELLLRPEVHWIRRRRRLPFGTSLLAVAIKD